MVRVTFLATPSKRRIFERMASEFGSHVVSDIISSRYPVSDVDWKRMSFVERLDEKLLGGTAIRESIRRFDPDIVYSDSPLYGSQFKLISLSSGKRRPLILHLRGDVWREHAAIFSSVSIRSRFLLLQQFSYDWAAVCAASLVTPVCRWLQRVVRRHVPGKRCEVVYVGVDPEEFRQQAGFEVRLPAVAILQNHSILPKVEGLLAFRTVMERLPQIHFYVAEGESGAQRYLSFVKKHLSGLSNVHFVGGITSPYAVSQMLTACQCYVLASGLDCCPSTVLEASLLEKPVLASRVGGVPEIIQDGSTGWAIQNGNWDEWVSKIQMVTQDEKLSRRLGTQGRRWVSERFGWRTIAPQVERLIENEVEGIR